MNENFGQPKRVDDIRVAQAMANEEYALRKQRVNDPNERERFLQHVGKREIRDITLEDIAEKISKTLSPEERSMIETVCEEHDNDSMEHLVRAIAKMNSQK